MDRKELYKKAWAYFGAIKQVVVAMEECAELIKALSKSIRGDIDILNIVEEIADVEIMIEQLKQYFEIAPLVKEAKRQKIKRLEAVLRGQNAQNR